MTQSLENYHEDLKIYKLNEKRYLATIMIENKINNINNNISIEREKKQEMLEYNFDILEKIKKMDLEQLDKIIESNHIIKESLDDTPETKIAPEIKNEIIKNRKIKLREIMDEILLNDELDKEETKFIEQIKEIMEITNITTIELDNMINNYEFIKRIDYHEEFNYLIKYLKII